MNIRPMTLADIDFALRLASQEGWSDIRSDFVSLITYKPTGAFVVEDRDIPVGMISTVSYGSFGFIGSLIVLPSHRQRGIGSEMIQHGIAYLRNTGSKIIMLDAVEAAIPIYESLGFATYSKSLRMIGVVEGSISPRVRQMNNDDLDAVFSLDKHHFGADRTHFLLSRFAEFPTLCKVLTKDDSIQGYIMGSHRHGQVRIAPWIIENPLIDVIDMIRAIAIEAKGVPLTLGLLECNTEAVTILKQLGLTETTPSTRMILGTSTNISFSDGVFAIGSPAKG